MGCVDEFWRANDRVSDVIDAAFSGVAAVSILATTSSVLLWLARSPLWLSAGVPSAAVVLAVITAAALQRRALRRLRALCGAS